MKQKNLRDIVSEAKSSESSETEIERVKLIAIFISIILHPLMMTIILAISISLYFNLTFDKYFSVFATPLIMVAIYIFFAVFIFKISDIEFSDVKTRPPLLITANIGLFISILIANILVPDLAYLLVRLLLVFLIVTFISFYWKISLHAIFFTLTVTFLSISFDIKFLSFLVLLPALYWSRIYLHKHHISQLIAGSLLSFLLLF